MRFTILAETERRIHALKKAFAPACVADLFRANAH
jgi:hypothetical protein